MGKMSSQLAQNPNSSIDRCICRYYVVAQEASRNSKSRLSKLRLTSDEKRLLLESPADGDGVVTKMKYILETHERKEKRSKWQKNTSKFFVNFCKVVDKTSALMQPMLPQSPEYTVTFGVLVLLFKVHK